MNYFFENMDKVFVVANHMERWSERDVIITLPLNQAMKKSYYKLKSKGMSEQLIYEYLFPTMAEKYSSPVMVQVNISDLTETQLLSQLRQELKSASSYINELPLHNMREILSVLLKAKTAH